jgi:hypothetical protein
MMLTNGIGRQLLIPSEMALFLLYPNPQKRLEITLMLYNRLRKATTFLFPGSEERKGPRKRISCCLSQTHS